MIVDTIRLVAAWLSDEATGINAQLEAVPRDAGEPPPDPVALYNEIDDDWVGRGQVPRSLYVDADGNPQALLLVRLHPDEQGFRAQILPEYDQPDPTIVPVVLLYLRRKIERPDTTVTVASQIRDARQTIRTAVRVIASQFQSSQTAIERNGCTITLPAAGLTLNSQFVDVGDDLVADTAVVPLRVQDAWALALT